MFCVVNNKVGLIKLVSPEVKKEIEASKKAKANEEETHRLIGERRGGRGSGTSGRQQIAPARP